MRSLRIRHRLHSGPSPSPRSVPSDIEVSTPVTSPNIATGMPSPLTRIQNQKVAFDRARMFIEAQHTVLVKSMNSKEKE